MTDKINGQGFRPADTAGTRRSEAAKPASGSGRGPAESAEKAAPTSDTVSITRSGLLLGKLEEVVQGTPVVDAERVAAVRDELASGSYEIDDRRIAERLLQLERDLG
jgi:negative regulator of flagellin synthesis FlgM